MANQTSSFRRCSLSLGRRLHGRHGRADARRQRNALQALVLDQTQRTNQYEQQQRQQQQIAQAKLAALLQAYGGDETKFAGALRSSGDPALWAKAGEVEKGHAGAAQHAKARLPSAKRDGKETSDMQAARRQGCGPAHRHGRNTGACSRDHQLRVRHPDAAPHADAADAAAARERQGKFVDWKAAGRAGCDERRAAGQGHDRPSTRTSGGQMVNVNPMAQGCSDPEDADLRRQDGGRESAGGAGSACV